MPCARCPSNQAAYRKRGPVKSLIPIGLRHCVVPVTPRLLPTTSPGADCVDMLGTERRLVRPWTCCLAIAALVAVLVGSGRLGAAQEGASIDPHADRVLRAMSAFLAAEQAFAFHAEAAVEDTLPTGTLVQLGYGLDVAIRRPDRIRADFAGDRGERLFTYDGETLTLLHRQERLYARAAAPSGIDAALDEAIDRLDVAIPLSDFAYSDPYAVLTERVEAGRYLGRHRVEGVPCHHLAFVQQDIDWQIWVEDGPQPVPRKLHVVYKSEPGAPRYTAVTSDWRLGLRLPDTVFAFDPPAGADEIGFAPVAAEEGDRP